VEIGDRKAVDVFLRREDAYAALEDIVGDEPDWANLLYVVRSSLDERNSTLKHTQAVALRGSSGGGGGGRWSASSCMSSAARRSWRGVRG
jgi:hypothetical protein